MNAALLAASMGTGKTKIVADIVGNMRYRKMLCICPLRVVSVWRPQFAMHCVAPVEAVPLDDSLRSVTQKRNHARQRVELAAATGKPIMIVVNYESAWRDPFDSWAMSVDWDLIVLDESHRIAAAGSKISKYCGRLGHHAKHRLCLTGTPLAHSPLSAYGQYRFLDPAIFGTNFHAFSKRYAVYGGFEERQVIGFQNMEDFRRRFFSIAFRVGGEVLDLAPPVHETAYCELGPEGKRAYKEMEQYLVAGIGRGEVTAANGMVKLLRLQQITGGTLRSDDGAEVEVDTSKRKLLQDLLEDLDDSEPVVVFCRFRADLAAVHTAAAALGRGSMELSGSRNDLAEWQKGAEPIIAVQISSGGVGIDLTRARYAFYYSIGFSLTEYEQSLARIRRPGQTRQCTYIHLCARGTVDERVVRAVNIRGDLVNSVLEGYANGSIAA